MEFINSYKEAVQNAKEKAAKLKSENKQAEQQIQELNQKYELHVQNLDFESARKVKAEIKEIELEIETKQDMIDVLLDPRNKGIAEAAKKAAKNYYEESEKLKKNGEALHKKVMKKREEYLESLKEITEHNAVLVKGHRELRQLDGVVNWKNPDVEKELGLRVHVLMNGNGGEMPMGPYFIRNLSDIPGSR